jgi:glycosyltransferase involved in cell wall biosynthesis/LmbE family N-acetylglucosaminyl deacetylase
MAGRGHEVVVLTPGEKKYACQESSNGIRLVRLPALYLGRIDQDLRVPMIPSHFAERVLDQFQPELVHVQDPSPLSQAVVCAARRRGLPAIISHHPGPEICAPYIKSENPLSGLAKWITWKIVIAHLNRADLVTVPSRYSAEMLASHSLRTAMQVIPCGVRMDHFRPNPDLSREAVRQRYGLASEKTLFLYVGRIDVEKNLPTLLEAMARLSRSDVQLAIAGRGMQEASLRRLAGQLGLDNRVRFLGQVARSALPDLLCSADVFVMPGNAESFSIATLEAMACAKPILAADAAALPELVTHGRNGCLFRADQPDAAVHAIEGLASCRDQWAAMGMSSLARATHYSQLCVVQAYEQVYRAALQRCANRVYQSDARPTGPEYPHGRKLLRSLCPSHLLAALLIFLLVSSVFVYDQAQAISNLRLEDLAPLQIEAGSKLLVISPHPDDETLAAGGLLQRVLETGGRVRVVFLTNGDGQYLSPLVVNGKVRPKSADYTIIGQLREVEALQALGKLGICQDTVDLLGYPDGKLHELWMSDWRKAAPVIAPYTRATRSPYKNTYNSDAIYLGAQVYDDLLKIIDELEPDIIVVPHPEDTHLDHRAAGNFARFAVAGYLAQGGHKLPRVLTYLVHYEAYPVLRVANTNAIMLPPAPLAHRGEGWVTLALTGPERHNKLDALRTYVSQEWMTGRFLRSFARANEIFYELPVVEMPYLGRLDEEAFEMDPSLDYAITEPSRERLGRLVLAGADLVSWRVMRMGSILYLGAETRGPTSQKLDCRILIKVPGGDTLLVSRPDVFTLLAGNQFGTFLDLGDLGNPSIIGFSAETWQGIMLDQTAWHFICLADFG